MTALLEVNGLTKRFGGVTAVDNCSFTVAPGTITALIGPNGSGKTTVFNMITGYLKPDEGGISFDGQVIEKPSPAGLYREGLSRTFQQARIFPELSVQENLVVAAGYSWRGLFGARVSKADRVRAGEMLEEFRLSGLADLPAADLSYGQRKLLEFAAVLMSRPKLVLLDEPTAGVNPVMIDTMERHVRARHKEGVTFLIVEHDMQLVMRLCDPVIVLDRGATIAMGTPADVQINPLVLDAYLGD
ncbi:ABC transporter ATP-binding protein [Tardiphaga sp.]|jgi:ABC-type branched-subunit amino acid transport system ATPase component|uniref:ABC transporter ATP-binding protein n=1 Tax=Tardiphaga sp. TaxID=1926292 RepID=UPI00260472BD|nr:ABC transporter ATP-binding protein [Tardiphaga sp.]MDB5621417.1 transporter ATP-binding protein [Tardiphaga sp.]MDQ1554906.1 branched-chain amino acid transport system ATP-binding protein [Microbacteriaceae bacterium]MDQ1577351.1 branched-chain amino acid transport system ATP-binding protein [Microbacteriaceae bacterium]